MSGSAFSRTSGRRSTPPSSDSGSRQRSCSALLAPRLRRAGRRRRARAHRPRGSRTRPKGRKMSAVIEARGLTKSYGATRALDGVSFSVEPGRIVGLIGPNGAGKTTALKAILGLTAFAGELSVLGLDPRTRRDELMREVCFIADVAVLPRWLRVGQALGFVGS